MNILSSVRNPIVMDARSLQNGRERQKKGCFLADGEHLVEEALQSISDSILRVFVSQDSLCKYESLLSRLDSSVERYMVTAQVMEAISQVKTPQGIAAVCRIPESIQMEQFGDRMVLLENVQDPGNVGTVLRTIDAVGFNGCILVGGCADPYGPKALRAAMGSAFRMPLRIEENAESILCKLNQKGYATIAAALDGEPFYQREPLHGKICLCIGNEGNGLKAQTIAQCTHRYRLPMRGQAESLNAAVACAVMMYDLMRGMPG